MSDVVPCSQAALDRWKEELGELESRGRAEVAALFAQSRDDGAELTENAAYQMAIADNERLQVRIDTLVDLIARAQVARRSRRQVSVGTIVELSVLGPRKRKAESMQVHIDAVELLDDPDIVWASPWSPLGTALLGAAVGSEVSWQAPAGAFRAEVVAIELAPAPRRARA